MIKYTRVHIFSNVEKTQISNFKIKFGSELKSYPESTVLHILYRMTTEVINIKTKFKNRYSLRKYLQNLIIFRRKNIFHNKN